MNIMLHTFSLLGNMIKNDFVDLDDSVILTALWSHNDHTWFKKQKKNFYLTNYPQERYAAHPLTAWEQK
jgi:hypothetical protein